MLRDKLRERLIELPLFQGMSMADVDNAATKAKFRCTDFAKGKTIVEEGGLCDCLFFLLEGVVNVTGYADDKGYSITETLSAPDIIQPERIFGLTQRYARTVTAKTDCTFVCICKKDFSSLSDEFEIFRLNLLNMVCTQSQRLSRLPWRTEPTNIRHKIARFVKERSLKPAGMKILNIKMERLSREIGESRLNTSRELNSMKEQGIISLRRGEIQIDALEKLMM